MLNLKTHNISENCYDVDCCPSIIALYVLISQFLLTHSAQRKAQNSTQTYRYSEIEMEIEIEIVIEMEIEIEIKIQI